MIYTEVQNGQTGMTAITPQQVAEALLALVDDSELRTRIGEAAREHVREKRAIEVVAKKWVGVFERVLEG